MSKDSKSVLSNMRKQAKKERKFFKRQADYGTLWLPKITANDKVASNKSKKLKVTVNGETSVSVFSSTSS